MTIKQLKEMIKDLNDDVVILTPPDDHYSIRLVRFSIGTAMVSGGVHAKCYECDFGEKQTKSRKRIDCLIVE